MGIYQIEDLKESIVKHLNGRTVKIKDVATVKIGASDKIGDGSLNGKTPL